MQVAVFEFNGKKYKVEISPTMAYKELPQRFEINLLKMFADEETNKETLQTLIMDDDKMLHLMYFFLEKNGSTLTLENVLSQMENLAVLDTFRDAFWAGVINFSPPLKKNILLQIWDQMKKEIKDIDFQSQE